MFTLMCELVECVVFLGRGGWMKFGMICIELFNAGRKENLSIVNLIKYFFFQFFSSE